MKSKTDKHVPCAAVLFPHWKFECPHSISSWRNKAILVRNMWYVLYRKIKAEEATNFFNAVLLNFVAFLGVASLFVRGVDNRKSEVDNRKRGGRQQKSSRADKWNNFLIIWPVWVRLLFWVSFRFGPASGWGPLPVGTYFRLVYTSGWGPLPAEGWDVRQLDKEANSRTATGS